MKDIHELPAKAGTSPPATVPAAAHRIRAVEVLLVALWFGLAAGFAEAALLPLRRLLSAKDPFLVKDPYWMIGAADVLYFALAGLLLVPVVAALRRWPRLASPRVPIFVFAAIGFASLCFLFQPFVTRKPALLLTAGAAFQTSRVVSARYASFVALVRRTLPWMAGALVAVAVLAHGWTAASEWTALRGLPAPPPSAPNVLLVVLDTVRAESLGLHGYSRPTSPELERFAKDGVKFDHAVAPAPWTLPTHASLFTGVHPATLGVDYVHPLGRDWPTLAEVLGSHGYVTAGFAANREYCGLRTGLGRGFARYEDFPVRWQTLLESPALFQWIVGRARRAMGDWSYVGRVDAPEVSSEFLGWIDDHPGRPFFAFLNYFDAHEPFDPPPPYDRLFGDRLPPTPDFEPTRVESYAPAEIDAFRDRYDCGVAYLDHEIGLLLEKLRSRGLLEKTLVIVTSDHGEEFGEHVVMGHSASLYMPSLHVPLVMSLPSSIPAGRTVAEPVDLRALGATILDVAGLREIESRFPGESLAPRWAQGATLPAAPILSHVTGYRTQPKSWPSGAGPLHSIVLDGFHYIRSDGDRPEELYRWPDDLWEATDLAGAPEHRATLERCRAELDRRLGR